MVKKINKDLTAVQKLVLFEDGTEPPDTSELNNEKREGSYHCANCGAKLFESGTKYESGSGWPSFYDALPNAFETISASSGIINVSEKGHGRSTGDTVRFRGPIHTTSDPDGFENPISFDGITGSNLAKAAGYSITVGKRDSSGNIANTENFYHFTVDTDTATTGGTSGGGKGCSSGPATLTA